jgi:hypothetical protein
MRRGWRRGGAGKSRGTGVQDAGEEGVAASGGGRPRGARPPCLGLARVAGRQEHGCIVSRRSDAPTPSPGLPLQEDDCIVIVQEFAAGGDLLQVSWAGGGDMWARARRDCLPGRGRQRRPPTLEGLERGGAGERRRLAGPASQRARVLVLVRARAALAHRQCTRAAGGCTSARP